MTQMFYTLLKQKVRVYNAIKTGEQIDTVQTVGMTAKELEKYMYAAEMRGWVRKVRNKYEVVA